jgi:alcohol dehydrogenase class IV
MYFLKKAAGQALMLFEFSTTARIIFGLRSLRTAGNIFRELGTSALIISGVSGQPIEENLLNILKEEGINYSIQYVYHEPTIRTVQSALELAHGQCPDFVIGFGGGSSIDTGKAVSILYTNPGNIYEYLEVVGKGQPLLVPPIPMIAVPTTSGTGSEVTRNAVMEVEEQGMKVSLRSPNMYPRIALIDPELTLGLPPQLTAYTGLDALTQLIEPFVSNKANPLTDAICREGIKLVGKSLEKAYTNGGDTEARENMALASLMGGLALANAKLGAVHGFAAPLGGVIHAAHGAICASLLPNVMAINLVALSSRKSESDAIEKYTQIAHLLTGNLQATAQDGIDWVRRICCDLKIPGLGCLGLTVDLVTDVITKAANSSSMAGNPIRLTDWELLHILNVSM